MEKFSNGLKLLARNSWGWLWYRQELMIMVDVL
jgi:hypothetical protein